MRGLLDSELVERLLFAAIVIGILLAGYAALQYVHLSNQLAGNMAAQIHDSGGEVTVESKSQAQGLMASDIARRRMEAERSNMMVLGGVGLAVLGLGWLGYDLARGRRRRAKPKISETGDIAP